MESQSLFSYGYMRWLAAAVLVMAVLALAAYAQATWDLVGQGQYGPTTISVQGEGEVLAKPDIGTFSFSVRAEGVDAAAAQEASAEDTNAILAFLDSEGVEEKDVKTQNYNLNPKYRYEERVCVSGSFCPPGERVIDGYEVNQSVTVKVRDLDAAGDLISGVGERGATNISSLQFTIDDESTLEAEARAKAIADAKTKAKLLAKDLDVKLVKIAGFYEENGGFGGEMYFAESRTMNLEMAMDEAKFSPELPTGENMIRRVVNITYEVK